MIELYLLLIYNISQEINIPEVNQKINIINNNDKINYSIYYTIQVPELIQSCCYPSSCYLAKNNPNVCYCEYMVYCR